MTCKRKLSMDDCDRSAVRKAKLASMTDTSVDLREFRSQLVAMHDKLCSLKGSNTQRSMLIEAIEGLFDLSDCPQGMIAEL
jgi:hypothetical protein